MEEDLEQACFQIKDPFQRWTATLKLTRDALKRLRAHVNDLKFKDKSEEIPIFKHIKPSFYQWQIYYTELYNTETNLPHGDAEKQAAFLEQELLYIERFFRQYAFLYQYYKLNATELDNLYFVRGAEIQSILLPEVPDLDPEFSTSCDYLFSKFKAFEALKDWLQERLLLLRKKNIDPQTLSGNLYAGDMKWTGDTIDLAEVGLGFYHTGKLNNGTAGLGEIFRWLEETFHVNIGVPAKRFAELRKRKRLSRTRFLNEMRDSLTLKMESEDEYIPTGKKKSNSAIGDDE
ncbi:MAG TPA: RteC domain-containing protein [Bacteroidia bacterium]|nr:RteC domain-containing protein [Bacteroidia bacterium]